MSTWTAVALLTASVLAPGPEVPSAQQITAVSAELQAQLQQQVIQRASTREQRMERLVEFVLDQKGLAMGYGDNSTLTIEQALQARKANCLTFTLMFVTLARQAGLDAYVQEADHVLAWHEEGGTVYSSGHVNAGVKIGSRRRTIDIDRSIVMSGRPHIISDERALAHFYNNRGVELMDEGQMAAARQHLEIAIRMTPDYVPAWNNLGVLNLRAGDPQAAERAYLTGLSKEPKHAASLLNLVQLYQRTHNLSRVSQYQDRLLKVQMENPFHQYLLAMDAEKRGDYANAVALYQRAIRLHNGEHRFYFGLARAYTQLGHTHRAKRALVKARDVADNDKRGLYQSKLDSLRWAHR